MRAMSGEQRLFAEIHASLQDVEELFKKYRVDLIDNTADIDRLEDEGKIPAIMADKQRQRIKEDLEAESKPSRPSKQQCD